jgi:hypothetical protein
MMDERGSVLGLSLESVLIVINNISQTEFLLNKSFTHANVQSRNHEQAAKLFYFSYDIYFYIFPQIDNFL